MTLQPLKVPTIPIPFQKLLKIVASVDPNDVQTKELLEQLAAERYVVEVTDSFDRGRGVLDYFLAFQESFNRYPGFNYEVQGVYQEREGGRIRFYTYVVRE